MKADLLSGRSQEDLRAEAQILEGMEVLERHQDAVNYAEMYLEAVRALYQRFPLEQEINSLVHHADQKLARAKRQVETTERMCESRMEDLRRIRDAAGT